MRSARDTQKYQLSFTSGSLFLQGAPIAAKLYAETGDWALVRARLRAENLLQARTDSTASRLAFEVVQRLGTLSSGELALLADATSNELRQLMWIATCRHYSLIGEFAEEVLRDRYLLLKRDLLPMHFDSFVNAKKLWHEELSTVAESTFKRLRSNLFGMLREAELVTDKGMIVPTVISARVLKMLSKRIPSDVRFFPTSDVT